MAFTRVGRDKKCLRSTLCGRKRFFSYPPYVILWARTCRYCEMIVNNSSELISNFYRLCLYGATAAAATIKVYEAYIYSYVHTHVSFLQFYSISSVYMLKLLIITNLLVQNDNICCDSNPPFFALYFHVILISCMLWNLQIMIYTSTSF
jgi:hypothetical protein